MTFYISRVTNQSLWPYANYFQIKDWTEFAGYYLFLKDPFWVRSSSLKQIGQLKVRRDNVIFYDYGGTFFANSCNFLFVNLGDNPANLSLWDSLIKYLQYGWFLQQALRWKMNIRASSVIVVNKLAIWGGRIEMKRCRKRDLNKNYAFESITTAWSEIKTTFWRSESHLNGFPPAAAAPPRQIFSTLVWKWDFKTWKRNATGRFWIFTSNQMVEEVFQFGTKSQSTWSTCTKQTVCT